MTLTLNEKEKFLRNKREVGNVVRTVVKEEKGVIFGARAVNKQVPPHLRRQTEDFDIFVKKEPKRVAKKIERRLDKRFGGNFFEVKPAAHPGTTKVVSRISKTGTADVSKHPKEKIGIVKRKGVKFANLNFQKQKIKESLADPKSKFRHDKDRFSRLRIKLAESKSKKKVVRKRKPTFRKRTLNRIRNSTEGIINNNFLSRDF